MRVVVLHLAAGRWRESINRRRCKTDLGHRSGNAQVTNLRGSWRILSYGRGALQEGLSRVPHRKPPETRYVMIPFDIGLLLTLNQRVQGSNPCTPTIISST